MAERKYFLLSVRTIHGFPPYLTSEEVAGRCGIHPDLVDRFMRLGLIDCAGTSPGGDVLFHVDVVPLIRRILRLRNQLGVNYAGIGVILELMSRVEELENQIMKLEKRIFEGD
jgi:DNA-binding transcriptional MerR regulator